MITILFGVLIGIVQFYGEQLSKSLHHANNVISFTAGISITYIFLHLFPQFSAGVRQINDLLFVSVLLGFIALHLVEKYIYHTASKNKLRRELSLEDSVTTFIYHFIIGLLLVSINVQQNAGQTFLFFFAILAFTAASTLPVDPPKRVSMRVFVASATVLGVLFGEFFQSIITLPIFYSLLGFTIGVLLFSTIRHSLPKGKHGNPWAFILGSIFYSAIIFLSLAV